MLLKTKKVAQRAQPFAVACRLCLKHSRTDCLVAVYKHRLSCSGI